MQLRGIAYIENYACVMYLQTKNNIGTYVLRTYYVVCLRYIPMYFVNKCIFVHYTECSANGFTVQRLQCFYIVGTFTYKMQCAYCITTVSKLGMPV